MRVGANHNVFTDNARVLCLNRRNLPRIMKLYRRKYRLFGKDSQDGKDAVSFPINMCRINDCTV